MEPLDHNAHVPGTPDMIDEGVHLWASRIEEPLSREQARQIAENICGYFGLLAHWAWATAESDVERAWREPTPSPLEFLTVTEAANQIGIHPETLRRRIRAGTLRAYGRPRTLRVKLKDLLQPYRPARRAP
jgi:excisionase family DNA binding protein